LDKKFKPEKTLCAVTATATTIFQNVLADWDIVFYNIPLEHIVISLEVIQCVPYPINHKRL
jgi:hypothetical protein